MLVEARTINTLNHNYVCTTCKDKLEASNSVFIQS